ncbi:MAG: L-lactate permease [Ktedonobacteraceae bacterium]
MEVLLAALPLIVALVMLAVLRRSGLQTSIVTLCVAIGIALLIPSLHLSPVPLLIALVSGFSTSLTVLSVLFPALLLYQLQQTRNGMSVLAQAIVHLCPDNDLLMLLIVLGLAPFIECFSGFGVGTVVVVPIFVAIGADPLQAALLGLLGQIAVPWGGLAVGITLGAQLTHLDPNMLGAYTALIAAPLPVGFGLFTLIISGGRAALARRWYAACVAGLVLAAGEWFFSLTTSVELAGALASLVCLLLLALWSYSIARKTRITQREDTTLESASSENKNVVQHDIHSSKPPLWRVIAPYILLSVALLLSRLVLPIRSWLQTHVVLAAPVIALHLQVLYIPGFYVLLAACAAIPLLSIKGPEVQKIIGRTWSQFLPGAIAIVCFLATSQVMQTSGMIGVLGTTAATLGSNYGWIAPWLGALGGWLTGSNAGGNAMFAQLQQAVSRRVGLPLHWIMASQNGAGSIATMASPSRTLLATTAAGLVGQESVVLRKIGPAVLLAIVVVTLLLVGILFVGA